MRQTARSFAAKDQRRAVIALAGQCALLGDAFLADELVGLATKDVPEAERLPTLLAAIEFHLRNNQAKQAEALLDILLKDAKLAENANLWFLAAALAGRQKPTIRSVLLYDKALEIEYRHLPEVINVQQLRSDYGQLLLSYQQAIAAMSYVGMEPPKELDLVGRVVRAADRWRSIDPEPTQVCQAAASILKQLGASDLAWDYLTTPTALRPNDAAAQLQLAQSLLAEGSYDLADKAFATAFEAESTNAEILMQRAQGLQAAGRGAEARKVYRQIANGTWQPRFNWIQQQARSQLNGR
jgi:tetratricopeptide (TPR) repeat protein